jgi:triphosphoribosyl-dephospho-CoA synthase
MISKSFSLGQLATAACLLEIAAPKPGNIHRAADFEDMTFYDLCLSAVAIGPEIQSVGERGVGASILSAVQATRRAVGKNTNLGTVLLLAPLACADSTHPDDIDAVLDQLDSRDARNVYEAIRLARPGGLGTSEQYDVNDDSPADLLVAMRAAAERDLIARQYACGFADLHHEVLPWLGSALEAGYGLPDVIVHVHLKIMQSHPDSLIARKRGRKVARESAARASVALESGNPGDPAYEAAVADLDFWLRCDGHARNPGTTADMIAAGLFMALRNGTLDPHTTKTAVGVEERITS